MEGLFSLDVMNTKNFDEDNDGRQKERLHRFAKAGPQRGLISCCECNASPLSNVQRCWSE